MSTTIPRCGDRFAVDLNEFFEDGPARPADFPPNMVGALTFCDGPKGHNDAHVGGILSGRYAIVWSHWPNPDGGHNYKIQNRRGDLL